MSTQLAKHPPQGSCHGHFPLAQRPQTRLNTLPGTFGPFDPRGPWELSIRLNLGSYCQRQACWSRALPHLIEAWGQSQDPTVPSTHRFADRTQVALGMGLLELGRIEALDELIDQTAGRTPRPPALGAAWRAVRDSKRLRNPQQ